MADDAQRIHHALARAGVASRRAAERMVGEGRVLVNDEPAVIGQLVVPTDRITVDGRRVVAEELRTYLLNKPRGAVSTASDPQGRPTVLDDLPRDVRLFPVGRLDLDTTGALVVTNDGELAHRLMHPRFTVPKVYEVLLQGHVSAATLRALRTGVELDDGPTLPATVERMARDGAGGSWLRIELTEGRNRQIRRMGEAVGHRVMRLHRVRYADLGLKGLAIGRWRPLKRSELTDLAARVGLVR
jgi:23S rRNA pseudouridine2605 synthase